MTTRNRGRQPPDSPTPDTQNPASESPRIRILRERPLTTTPAPGEVARQIAITFQIPPAPPDVLIVREDALPDLQFLRNNPNATEVPEAVQAQGDATRRRLILARTQNRNIRNPRTI